MILLQCGNDGGLIKPPHSQETMKGVWIGDSDGAVLKKKLSRIGKKCLPLVFTILCVFEFPRRPRVRQKR